MNSRKTAVLLLLATSIAFGSENALQPQHAIRTTAFDIFVPLIVVGGGWHQQIVLTNLDDALVEGELRIYNQVGSPWSIKEVIHGYGDAWTFTLRAHETLIFQTEPVFGQASMIGFAQIDFGSLTNVAAQLILGQYTQRAADEAETADRAPRGDETSPPGSDQGLPSGLMVSESPGVVSTDLPESTGYDLVSIQRTSIPLGPTLHDSLTFFFDHREGKTTTAAFTATFPCFNLIPNGCTTDFRIVARNTAGQVILEAQRRQANFSTVLVSITEEFPQLVGIAGSMQLLPSGDSSSILHLDVLPLQYDSSGFITALSSYGD